MAGERMLERGSRWEHYKGGKYTVLYRGLDEPTMKPVVIYQAHDGEGTIWVRTETDFLAMLDENGYIPRFKRID